MDSGAVQRAHARPRCVGQHADRPGAVDYRFPARLRRHLDGISFAAHRRCRMKHVSLFTVVASSLVLAACGGDGESLVQVGPNPELPEPRRGILPDMVIAEPAEWGDQLPTVPDGYTIKAIA